MSRKTTKEKNIEQLKRLFADAQKSIERYAAQRDSAQKELDQATADAAQLQDALDALEGRPTLKAKLETAISEAAKLTQVRVAEEIAPATPQNPNLPAPEAGLKWAKNELNQDVLIPIDAPAPTQADTVIPLMLPVVDESFDKPEDLL